MPEYESGLATGLQAKIAVDVRAADAACFCADENVIGADHRIFDVGAGELFVFGEEQCFHGEWSVLAQGWWG